MSLYDQLGGAPAIHAALDRFYEQVEEDPELAPYFDGIDFEKLKERIAPFFSTALGGPDVYQGPGLRATHRRVRNRGLDDGVVDRFLGLFSSTLEELGVPDQQRQEVMAIAEGGRDEVLDR